MSSRCKLFLLPRRTRGWRHDGWMEAGEGGARRGGREERGGREADRPKLEIGGWRLGLAPAGEETASGWMANGCL
eukprot:scaffold21264_cov57-Skeletonema_menzelii.AAC.1